MEKQLLNSPAIRNHIKEISRRIAETHPDTEVLVLAGIRKGEKLAERLAEEIERISGKRPVVGVIDTSLYRDDLGGARLTEHPVLCPTDIPCSVEGRQVILIDDVLYTGRTIRAAMDALIDLGRPAKIELAVLIDRGSREFPIQPDYAGMEISIEDNRSIRLELHEDRNQDKAVITSSEQVVNH
ncbi:MAG: bifunctional pyr operon transcriptional regulator/uracil phosphoribosyltransferase PyrR [bacterium]